MVHERKQEGYAKQSVKKVEEFEIAVNKNKQGKYAKDFQRAQNSA